MVESLHDCSTSPSDSLTSSRDRAVGIILSNIYHYYQQFLPAVQSHLIEMAAPAEKEFKVSVVPSLTVSLPVVIPSILFLHMKGTSLHYEVE